MTTTQPVPDQVRADVDTTLRQLRDGTPLTTQQRLGLAELLLNVRSASRVAQRDEHDNPDARSGLFLNVQDVYTREFAGGES